LAEPARTIGFCKLKIPHKKSFVPLAASCVKTKARTVGLGRGQVSGQVGAGGRFSGRSGQGAGGRAGRGRGQGKAGRAGAK